MGFIDELKSEIKTYSEELKTYYDNDFTKAWEIVNESSCKESEFYNGTVAPICEERDNVRNALREIPNFRKTASRIYELKTEEAIRKHYNRLVEIRTAVQKAFPNGLKVGENENEVDVATELLKQRNEELSKYNFDNYDDLSGYMSESDVPYAAELAKYLAPISFCKGIFPMEKYPNLMQLLTLTSLRSDMAECCSEFGNEFSIVFREEFDKLCNLLTMFNASDKSFCGKMFKTLSNEYALGKRNKFVAFSQDYRKEQGFVILDEKFLCDLSRIISENSNLDLFGLADCIRDIYGATIPKDYAYIEKTIKELARLYRETPDQVLVTEQRYYQQKQIEQLRENARQEREMMELQAQMEREEYAYQEEQNRRQMEKDRVSREWAERENLRRMEKERQKAEDEAREERRNRQNAAYKESYRKSMDEAAKRREAMHLCWKCANYGKGCHGGILGCGNYRPKN